MIFDPPPSRVPPHPTTRYAFPYLCQIDSFPPRTQKYYDTLYGISIDDFVSSQQMTAVSKLLIKEKQ